MKKKLQFLKELQATMKHEEEHDNDSQASPRFWTIMDYRIVPAHEDYNATDTEYAYNDGDHTVFNETTELKEFLTEYYLEDLEGREFYELRGLLEDDDTHFDDLWEFLEKSLNTDGYFYKIPVTQERFIVPNTMFLTKEEAKRHIELNHYHYTSKAHTYAMTAWRAPKVKQLLEILSEFDWDSVEKLMSE